MGNGFANCSNVTPPTTNELRTLSNFNSGNCSACPATLYQNCNSFGPEWTADSSVQEGAGCKLTCKRIGYLNADPSCCYGRQSSNPQITCDPLLVPGNSKCDSALINWCSNDANITSPYCTSNSDVANKVLNNYCTPQKILTSNICKNWVLSTKQQGNIDLVMQKYCNQNPTDSICCYMNSTIPCPNKNDTRCTNIAAYQTSAMVSTVCPNVLNCNQYINLSPSAKLFATNIMANCGGTSTKLNTNSELSKSSKLGTIASNFVTGAIGIFMSGVGIIIMLFIVLLLFATNKSF